MSEFRKDPITGRWRIIAPGRSARPNAYAGPPPARESDESCPFCEGHEARTPPETAAVRPAGGAADGPGWSVRAIPNRFPSVSREEAGVGMPSSPTFKSAPGYGVHEVVIEAPHHAPDLPYLSPDHLRVLFRFLRERVRAISAMSRIENVLLFENRGPESGGTLPHPHAQIVGSDRTPPRVAEEIAAFAQPEGRSGEKCRLEVVAAAERAEGTRVVWDDDLFLAFTPFASEFPYEVWIVPHRHSSGFAGATEAETDRLSALLPSLLRALDAARGSPSYNWFVHGSRPGAGSGPEFHWHVEVAPRIVRSDGYELGSGVAVNPVAPEAAATDYRARLAETERPPREKR